MFIEPNIRGERRGWIEVICGSMFSGKTEELIRRLKRVKIANLTVEIFKPAIDIRYDITNIVSHDTNAIISTPIDNSQKILLMAQGVDVIGIDEAQFFDDQLPYVCDELAYRGMRVIVAGLDMDFTGKPFGQMPFIMAKADFVTKLHAICVKCGHIANYSYRKIPNDDQVMLGEKDVYEPRCRVCYNEKFSMTSFRHIITLFKKDLLLEVRQQYSFYGILLYVGATIFVLFMALDAPEPKVWNGLFWVLQLFICINAVAKSFLQESKARMLYFYSIASPSDFVLAKLLFNTLLMLVMSLLSLFLYSLFLGSPVEKAGPFIGLVLLGGWSLSLIFTFLAAIAARAQQNAAIMAVLGFPLIIPQLLLLIRLSNAAFAPLLTIHTGTVLLLVALDIMVILLAVILFPFLWKD